MAQYSEGDRVRIDIPDETDPEHSAYHGEHGTITAIQEDDLDGLTGDERDAHIYQVELDNGEKIDFRWRDLRPLPDQ